jgi:hypothetical protein
VIFKSFITTVLVTLLLLVMGDYHAGQPNQELVIGGFHAIDVEQRDVFIAHIKEGLKNTGAEDLTALINDDGKLTISYKSNLNAALVLQLLQVPSDYLVEVQPLKELLTSSRLSVKITDLTEKSGQSSGCNAILNFELKTDLEHRAVDRPFTGIELCGVVHFRDHVLNRQINRTALNFIPVKDNSFIPDSRAGPVS